MTMTEKNKNKNFLQAEDAQAIVIGFVLIMGILIVASTSYFAAHIPEWTKDYESMHVANVADDFSELKSHIDGIVLTAKQGGTVAAGTAPIKMAPDKVPIFGMSPPGSSLNFLPDNETFKITPTVGGGGGGGAVGSSYWEQNATTGFDAIELENVDTSSNEVKLAKETQEYPNLTLDGTTAMLDGEHFHNQVIIKNSSILYLATSGSLKIHANNITVDSSSQIIADERGHWGGKADADGEGYGRGESGYNGTGGGGAGYGGDGGDGGGNSNSSGSYYGNKSSFGIRLGSGGGGGSGHWGGGSGGSGGGAILLEAEQINISGNVSANGGMGSHVHAAQDGGGGGGSGGCILLYGQNVTISGTLSVNGGNGGGDKGTSGGGGGAGGRIKVFHEESLDYTGAHSCSGGSGNNGGVKGADGTIYNESIPYSPSVPYVSKGRFVSEVYNTTSDCTCYGEMTWNATLNGETLIMKVRTDMFSDMRAAPDWLYCPMVANGTDISDLSSVADGHRFIQFRAELATDNTSTTPVLHSVRINYSLSAFGGGPVVAASSGIIAFSSNYFYYPNQGIVYEHGAVIKWQGEDEGKMGVMLHPPPINITNESGIPTLTISMVDLTGTECSYSGATTTSLKNSYNDYNIFSNSLRFPNLTLNLTTEYPSIWGKWFNETLETETNLTTPYHYNVSVNATAKNVVVEFYGHGNGVKLYLEKTAVEVAI